MQEEQEERKDCPEGVSSIDRLLLATLPPLPPSGRALERLLLCVLRHCGGITYNRPRTIRSCERIKHELVLSEAVGHGPYFAGST